MNWEMEKKKVIEKLEKEIQKERVDKDILNPNYVTLSSCSGRMVVLDLPKFGDKKACKFLGKWHEKTKAEEVIKALKKCKKQGWFIMQPAIFHVQCKTLQDAGNLINIAYSF